MIHTSLIKFRIMFNDKFNSFFTADIICFIQQKKKVCDLSIPFNPAKLIKSLISNLGFNWITKSKRQLQTKMFILQIKVLFSVYLLNKNKEKSYKEHRICHLDVQEIYRNNFFIILKIIRTIEFFYSTIVCWNYKF